MANINIVFTVMQDVSYVPKGTTASYSKNSIFSFSKQALADDRDLRYDLAMAVRKGILTARHGIRRLTPSEIENIDDTTEDSTSSYIYGGIINIPTPVVYYDILFGFDLATPYAPFVTLEDNVNFYVENVTTTGFRVSFSANYAGNLYWGAILV